MKILDSFGEELLRELNEKLHAIKSEYVHDSIKTSALSMQVLAEFIGRLKEFICGYDFKDIQEEIHFFKETKPCFVSLYLFHQEVFDIESDCPPYGKEEIAEYYKTQLNGLANRVDIRSEFTGYYRSGQTHLDDKFFVRSKDMQWIDHDADERFSTSFDSKVARIKAYDLLKEYIVNRLEGLEHPERQRPSTLRWTGLKTDLIELIYSLHAHGCINDGKAPIKELVGVFTTLFDIDLGEYYRTYLDIRIRKKGRTKFIDALKESLIMHMDEADEKMINR